MVAEEVKEAQEDEEGSYLDRFLAETKRANPGSSFYGKDGDIHIAGSVLDIFGAGKSLS